MNIPPLFRKTAFVGALVVLTVSPLLAQSNRPDGPRIRLLPMITSNESILTGEVMERTESGFTLMSKTSDLTTVLVTPDTAITKGAVTIHLSDLAVGDKVSVTVIRSADGKLVAVTVVVRVGNE